MKKYGKTYIKAVGVSFKNRQGALYNVRKHDSETWLTLRREKKNPNDPHAIQIIAHNKTTRSANIGYIPYDKALWLSKAMDNGLDVRAYRRKDKQGNPLPYVIGDTTLGCQFTVVYELTESQMCKNKNYF